MAPATEARISAFLARVYLLMFVGLAVTMNLNPSSSVSMNKRRLVSWLMLLALLVGFLPTMALGYARIIGNPSMPRRAVADAVDGGTITFDPSLSGGMIGVRPATGWSCFQSCARNEVQLFPSLGLQQAAMIAAKFGV